MIPLPLLRACVALVLLFSTAGARAFTVLGAGTGALLGGDLTDPENDGVDGAATN